jgi:hypothetical protein
MSASGMRPAGVTAVGSAVGALTVISAALGRERIRARSLVRQGGAS